MWNAGWRVVVFRGPVDAADWRAADQGHVSPVGHALRCTHQGYTHTASRQCACCGHLVCNACGSGCAEPGGCACALCPDCVFRQRQRPRQRWFGQNLRSPNEPYLLQCCDQCPLSGGPHCLLHAAPTALRACRVCDKPRCGAHSAGLCCSSEGWSVAVRDRPDCKQDAPRISTVFCDNHSDRALICRFCISEEWQVLCACCATPMTEEERGAYY